MKICPFVSHLLGEDGPNLLTLDEASDKRSRAGSSKKKKTDASDAGSKAGASKSATATATKEAPQDDITVSHLYCLREACRFYKPKTGDCQFDLMYGMLQENGNKDLDFSEITKDINKVWQFQTKSVSELIKSISESEKSHNKSLSDVQKDLAKSIESIGTTIEKAPDPDTKKQLEALDKKFDERYQAIDDLSTTMSDLVLNLHESIGQLQERSEKMFEQMARVDRSIAEEAGVKKFVENAMQDGFERLQSSDLDKSVKQLDSRIDTWIREQKAAEPEFEELNASARAYDELKAQMSSWHGDVAGKMEDLKTQQKIWEERIRKMSEQQDRLMSLLEESKQERKTDEVKTHQKEAKKLNNLGVTSFHNGAFDMAKDQFLQAVKADPAFSEAYNNLGLAYTELKQEDKATEAFTKALELNPALHAAYNNLGYIYFKKEDYDRAIEMYNEALGRSSDNSSAYTNLGNAYYKLGKSKEAREAWTRAIEIDPGNEKAKLNLRQMDKSN